MVIGPFLAPLGKLRRFTGPYWCQFYRCMDCQPFLELHLI